jgi:hypothetical protein
MSRTNRVKRPSIEQDALIHRVVSIPITCESGPTRAKPSGSNASELIQSHAVTRASACGGM